MYTDKVMDHFANPRNVGEVENANAVGEVGNASCGDIMRMSLLVEDNIIKDIKFKTFGCGSAIATSSIATEMVIGKTLEEAETENLNNASSVYTSALDIDKQSLENEALNEQVKLSRMEITRNNQANSS